MTLGPEQPMDAAPGAVVAVDGVTVVHRDTVGADILALDIAAVTFSPAKVSIITGASGSGKTTLLLVISGILAPSSGEVRVGGLSLGRLSEAERDHWRRRTVGLMFQDFLLVPELSPRANVAISDCFGGTRAAPGRADRLLEQLAVPPRRASVSRLSRGERQRVAFARALFCDPPLIIADEPTASLDAENAAKLIGELRSLANSGKTVIAASHDPALIAAADACIHLDHGRVAGFAPVDRFAGAHQ